MTFPAFITKKRLLIGLGVLLVLGIIWRVRSKPTEITYETAGVTRADLRQTVEVTGQLKPASRIDLTFKRSGTVSGIQARVGVAVKAGEVLATLKADDVQFAVRSAQASLAIAQANLASRAAGETQQSIELSASQVQQAEVAYQKALADVQSTKDVVDRAVQSASVALQAAQNNLDNADAIAAQNIQNSYDAVRTTLINALGPINNALFNGDQISGVDNSAVTQGFSNLLGVLEIGSLDRAKNSYLLVRRAKLDVEAKMSLLTHDSSAEDIRAATEAMKQTIVRTQDFLTDVQRVLTATITGSSLSATTLATYQTTNAADRAAVSAQATAVLSASQSLRSTELVRTQTIQQLKDAYTSAALALESAKTNGATQMRAAEATLATQQAVLNGAKATLEAKKIGPRPVDLAPLRAAVQQAAVAYEKAVSDLQDAQIVAPVDGTISEILPHIGEQVGPSLPAIRMVGVSSYEIESLVPEADIVKVALGQPVTVTLDAFGDDVKFSGTVTAKDPDQTKVQDAVYYKVFVQIDAQDKEIKPGMTANVTILTASREKVLVIPLRAIRTKDDKKTVRILVNRVPEERVVQLGLRGDEGRVEIMSGLQEYDQVIVGESTEGATK